MKSECDKAIFFDKPDTLPANSLSFFANDYSSEFKRFVRILNITQNNKPDYFSRWLIPHGEVGHILIFNCSRMLLAGIGENKSLVFVSVFKTDYFVYIFQTGFH